MKKIIIVIDEPKRDLSALLFFSTKLKSKGFQVFLISFLQLSKIELSFFEDSILISNHFRKNNIHFLAWLKIFKKTKIIIFDTEGVGSKDGLQVARNLKAHKNLHNIFDEYWLWNKILLKEIKKFSKDHQRFYVVGSYRFSKEFLSLKKKNIQNNKNQILINTNFAFIDPKFSNGYKEEFKTSLKTYDAVTEEDVKHHFEKRIKFLDILNKILSRYHSEIFVLRTHPFEKNDFWYNKLKSHKNLVFRSEGDVTDEILKSKFIIQNECTTAVEAFNLEVPAITFDWLFNDNYDTFIPRLASIRCKNIDEVFSNINLILSNNYKELNLIEDKVSEYFTNVEIKDDVFEICTNRIIKLTNQPVKLNFYYLKYILKYIFFKTVNIFEKEIPEKKIPKILNIKIIKDELSKYNLNFDVENIQNKIFKIN